MMITTLYDKFKHWSEKGSVYILSDTHFNDKDCPLMDKKWINPDEQVKILNNTMTKNDTLILLGDIGEIEYVKQLKGYKILIMGNHDSGKSNYLRKEYFKEIISDEDIEKYRLEKDFKGIKVINDKKYAYFDNRLFDEIYEGPLFISEKILLSHEPIYGLDFVFNIHGHDHNKEHIGDEYHLNVAANVCGYMPINLKTFIQRGTLKNIKTIHRKTIDKAKENPIHKKNDNKLNVKKHYKTLFFIVCGIGFFILFAIINFILFFK